MLTEDAKKVVDELRKEYWLIPKGLWATCTAVCAVLGGILGVTGALLSLSSGIEIDATKRAQDLVSQRIGLLAANGALDRIRKAAEDCSKGSALDRLSVLEQSSGKLDGRLTVVEQDSVLYGNLMNSIGDCVRHDPALPLQVYRDSADNVCKALDGLDKTWTAPQHSYLEALKVSLRSQNGRP